MAGLLLVLLFKNITENAVKESLNNFWKSLATGFILLLLIPIIIIVSFITVVGIWPGIIVGVFYVLSILLAISLAGITFGSWAISTIRKNKNYSVNWKIVIIGILGLTIIKLIPIIGGIVSCIFVLISLGAIYRLIHKRLFI